MLTNYVKIAWRNLVRYRTYSLLNILGLSVGLTCGILIYLTTQFHLSFDTYHAKAERTYRVVTQIKHDDVRFSRGTPKPLGEVLRRDYPFLEQVARVERLHGRIVSVPNPKGGFLKKFNESKTFCFAEPQLFSVFDYDWLIGDPQSALSTPNSVVLTEKYAHKYFGTANPIGKTLRFDNQADLTVTGVLKDHPGNTNLTYEAFISYSTIASLANTKESLQAWNDVNSEAMCYVVLPPDMPADRLASAFPAIRKKYYQADDQKVYDFTLQPLSDVHFNTQYGGRMNKTILFAMTLVGLFLVISACINFINMATAHALKRSKEVGVRKVMGSSRWQLFSQFMTETAIITLVAVVVALFFSNLGLPAMNKAMSVFNATMVLTDLLNPKPLAMMILGVVFVILLAGFYPALMMAGFNPITALRGRLTTQAVGGFSVRRGLVVVQFFMTQLFTIGVVVVMTQLRHIRQADLGFVSNGIVLVDLPNAKSAQNDPLKQETFRQQLLQISGVQAVALGNQPPASGNINQFPFVYDTRTKPEGFDVQSKIGDPNYLPLFGMKLLAGRNFRPTDSTSQEVIVNETVVKRLGKLAPSDVLGKRFRIFDTDKTIVGVVNDFYTNSLRNSVKPVVIVNDLAQSHMIALKVSATDLPKTLKTVEATYNDFFPEKVFSYQFVDTILDEFYRGDRIMLALTQVFSLIAILIGCLGMYGLVSFMVETKSKEIGVRKVLGASAFQVLWLFGWEFGRLVLLGFLLAAPLGWWLMNAWLRDYVYRIQIQGWMFGLTIVLAALITLLTVSFQSVKAALMNPVKSLRSE
ncbi:FtsX-like permease family protein [Spirosoma sp. KCTC 42546]|uniref:ABC transporter permease n=1 Tax=Spirosoma sp. KCTC 42546 TaxID=2520506 RepID=UPI00115BF21A|nr:ABC transporter permease [Spirosoma sp. KCTC 42546]QDK77952.1 FtsX-like permease family protein [Spirosoma sp. KCTC 42546]